MCNNKFARSSWNKPQPVTNPMSKPKKYDGFATNDKHKEELQRILQKEVPSDAYVITMNQTNYYIYLYQSQWNALRNMLLYGTTEFKNLSIDTLISVLEYKYPGIQSINNEIKTSEILRIYISNGLSQIDIDELSDQARIIASTNAANGKLL